MQMRKMLNKNFTKNENAKRKPPEYVPLRYAFRVLRSAYYRLITTGVPTLMIS
jgi:hypothetical protein